PKPSTRNPKPQTRNPKPETRNPKPAILNSKPRFSFLISRCQARGRKCRSKTEQKCTTETKSFHPNPCTFDPKPGGRVNHKRYILNPQPSTCRGEGGGTGGGQSRSARPQQRLRPNVLGIQRHSG
ncbi:hypothetical protein T484DRAFT_1649812, partial [Baffinella frigidus]